MAPKKKKTPFEPKVKFTATIPLPKIKGAGKYFQDFWKKLNPNGSTLSVKIFSLFINAENDEMLTNTRATIETEMKKFIESNRPLTKILPKTKNSYRTKGGRKHKELISHNIIRRTRIREQKYSEIEYHQQKALGRKPIKSKRAHRAKRRNKRRKTKKNKWKQTILKNASKYNLTLNKHSRTASEISKLKFLTADAARTMMLHLKNKKESHLAMISGGKLGGEYEFSLFPWVDMILVDRNKFVIRYYNQQIFIYTASIGTNRPLKRNLVYTFSTLNGNEIKSNWYTEHTRFSPMKQPP
jgi:hypothetical protein